MNLNNTLQNSIYKITHERFDEEEINAYLSMAIEEFFCWGKNLSSQELKKWIKSKLLQYACSALLINSTNRKAQVLYRKKSSYYRNKSAKFFD